MLPEHILRINMIYFAIILSNIIILAPLLYVLDDLCLARRHCDIILCGSFGPQLRGLLGI